MPGAEDWSAFELTFVAFLLLRIAYGESVDLFVPFIPVPLFEEGQGGISSGDNARRHDVQQNQELRKRLLLEAKKVPLRQRTIPNFACDRIV